MARLIDADALVDAIKDKIAVDKEIYPDDEFSRFSRVGMRSVIGIIKNQDTVDEVKHGHWVQMGPPNKNSETIYRCSICDYLDVTPLYDTHNYCGRCGARMDGDDK